MASLMNSMSAAPKTTNRSRPQKRKSAGTATLNGGSFTKPRRPAPVMASSSDPLDPYDSPGLSSMSRPTGGHPSSDSLGDGWGQDFSSEVENYQAPSKKPRLETRAVTAKLDDLALPSHSDDSYYDSFFTDDMDVDLPAADDIPVPKRENGMTRIVTGTLLSWTESDV